MNAKLTTDDLEDTFLIVAEHDIGTACVHFGVGPGAIYQRLRRLSRQRGRSLFYSYDYNALTIWGRELLNELKQDSG